MEVYHREKMISRTKLALVYILLILFIVVVLFPVFYCLISSFKESGEILAGQNFWPEKWQWGNYVEAWNKANFSTYTWNTVV